MKILDEERKTIFCLIDAADKDAVQEMHSKTHGLVPNKNIQVSSSIVESILGRIYDPDEVKASEDGLKVFSDPSFRVLFASGRIVFYTGLTSIFSPAEFTLQNFPSSINNASECPSAW